MAAPYRRRAELQGYARDLETIGHTVTSRWLDGSHDSCDDTTPDIEQQASWAAEAANDVRAADALILFTDTGSHRGGNMVEFGYALHVGLDIVVVGPRANVFCCLPEVTQFDTWPEVLASLADWEDGTDAEVKEGVAW